MLTTIADTAASATGSQATGGYLIVSWPAFRASDSHQVRPGNAHVPLNGNGHFSIALEPSTSAVPPFQYEVEYNVTYTPDRFSRWRERWSVPESSEPQSVAAVLAR